MDIVSQSSARNTLTLKPMYDDDNECICGRNNERSSLDTILDGRVRDVNDIQRRNWYNNDSLCVEIDTLQRPSVWTEVSSLDLLLSGWY